MIRNEPTYQGALRVPTFTCLRCGSHRFNMVRRLLTIVPVCAGCDA